MGVGLECCFLFILEVGEMLRGGGCVRFLRGV